jgi:hypothetical protein
MGEDEFSVVSKLLKIFEGYCKLREITLIGMS